MSSRTACTLSTALALLLIASGCPKRTAAGHTNAKEKADIVKQREDVLRDAEKKRTEWSDKLKSMDVPQLSATLASESDRGLEPFNSMAFAETVRRGETIAPALAQSITRTDRSSLLALLAVRTISRPTYTSLDAQRRVAILVDALRSSKTFNTWGLPHVRWEYAAQSLIEEGANAERALYPLLADKRPAPVWGGEDYLEYQRYMYRVCDYAWAMFAAIRQQKIEIPTDPAARDRAIAAIK
jgi:Tfp pilus assembly protein PilN